VDHLGQSSCILVFFFLDLELLCNSDDDDDRQGRAGKERRGKERDGREWLENRQRDRALDRQLEDYIITYVVGVH